MSNGPVRSEQAQAAATRFQEPSSSAPVQKGAFSVAASVAMSGVGAATTVTSRVLGFGALGFSLGVVAFFLERATGLLAHPWEPWSYLVYLLLLAYAVVGALCLGTAGMWRGIGRVAMNLVEEHQLTHHILNRVFEQAALLTAGEDTPEALRKPLPIQAARDALSRAIAAYSQGDELERGARGLGRAILRRLKRWVCRRVEAQLIALIGEETRDASIVELSLSRLRERAQEDVDERVKDALEGARNQQAFIWMALCVMTWVLPPLVLARLR